MIEVQEPNTRPLISIIVPVYNVVEFLPRCVDSILEQESVLLEVLLVDDGSTDGCDDLCDIYAADPRVRVIHQPNSGQSIARNVALGQIRGLYFMFVDADDWLAPRILARCVSYIRSHPNVELLEFAYSKILEEECRELLIADSSYVQSGLQALSSYVRQGLPYAMPWGKLFRTDTLGHLRFPEGRIYEDTSFVFEALSLVQEFHHVPWVGYCYRCQRRGSSTYTYDSRLEELFLNLLELKDRCAHNRPELLPYVHTLFFQRFFMFYLWSYRHRAEQPSLERILTPYIAFIRGNRRLQEPILDHLRNQLFLCSPCWYARLRVRLLG